MVVGFSHSSANISSSLLQAAECIQTARGCPTASLGLEAGARNPLPPVGVGKESGYLHVSLLGTWLVGMVAMGFWLDMVISEVFSNPNDSMSEQVVMG